jgi:lysophospholipase L1-like esterase
MRLSFVLLLLFGLIGALGLLATRQPSERHYQRERLARQLAEESAAPEGAVVLIGDSIIEDLDATAVASGALNFGIGGDTSRGLRDRVGRYKSLLKAHAVFLEIGINDLLHATGEDVVANYRGILAALPKQPRLYLIGLLPVDEQALLPVYGRLASNAEIARLNAAAAELCRARDNCVPLEPFGAGPLRADYHSGDGVHLSEAGYRVLVAAMKAALAEP